MIKNPLDIEYLEEIIKRKFHLKEEDIKEIISLIKENNNSPISSEGQLHPPKGGCLSKG